MDTGQLERVLYLKSAGVYNGFNKLIWGFQSVHVVYLVDLVEMIYSEQNHVNQNSTENLIYLE